MIEPRALRVHRAPRWPSPNHISASRTPNARFNVSGFPAGLRDRSQCPVGCARQGGGSCSGEENRSVGVGRLATGAGYVRARSSGTGGLRPGQKRVCSARWNRTSKIRRYRDDCRPVERAYCEDRRYVKTLDIKAIDAAPEREITFPLGQNKGQMKGGDYLNHFVLPNFYFHLTAAYAVVRNFGVDVGKRDFLGAIPLKRI